jgi:SAM-dependent methyltransferase
MEHHHHHHHAAPDDAGEAGLADLFDLDAEVLGDYLFEVTDWVRQLASPSARRRILDLGAGTGTGTIALAQRFPAADVIAVDRSELMLARIRAKAVEHGLADRVHTVRADLDEAMPAREPVDLVWASMSLHHLADPDRVLADVRAAMNPGGLLAVAEMRSATQFLPADRGLGRPGLEARCRSILDEERSHAVPLMDADWGRYLERSGFDLVAERTFTIDLTPPLPPAAGRYAQAHLRRVRSALDGRLAAEDLSTLDRLLDAAEPEGVLHRGDLNVRGTRIVWVARRP